MEETDNVKAPSQSGANFEKLKKDGTFFVGGGMMGGVSPPLTIGPRNRWTRESQGEPRSARIAPDTPAPTSPKDRAWKFASDSTARNQIVRKTEEEGKEEGRNRMSRIRRYALERPQEKEKEKESYQKSFSILKEKLYFSETIHMELLEDQEYFKSMLQLGPTVTDTDLRMCTHKYKMVQEKTEQAVLLKEQLKEIMGTISLDDSIQLSTANLFVQTIQKKVASIQNLEQDIKKTYLDLPKPSGRDEFIKHFGKYRPTQRIEVMVQIEDEDSSNSTESPLAPLKASKTVNSTSTNITSPSESPVMPLKVCKTVNVSEVTNRPKPILKTYATSHEKREEEPRGWATTAPTRGPTGQSLSSASLPPAISISSLRANNSNTTGPNSSSPTPTPTTTNTTNTASPTLAPATTTSPTPTPTTTNTTSPTPTPTTSPTTSTSNSTNLSNPTTPITTSTSITQTTNTTTTTSNTTTNTSNTTTNTSNTSNAPRGSPQVTSPRSPISSVIPRSFTEKVSKTSNLQLTFSVYTFTNEFWLNATTIDSVVASDVHRSNHDKIQHMYSFVKELIEGFAFKRKELNQRANLVRNLRKMQLYIVGNKSSIKKMRAEFMSWIELVLLGIRNEVMYEYYNLFDECVRIEGIIVELEKIDPNTQTETDKPSTTPTEHSFKDLQNPKNQFNPTELIVDNLLEITKEDNTIEISKFVEKFQKQVASNYSRLEEVNFTVVRHRINVFVKGLNTCISSHIYEFFNNTTILKINQLREKVTTVRDSLLNFISYLEGHLNFVESLLENIKLDAFSGNIPKILQYYYQHKERFEAEFSKTSFPFSVPNIIKFEPDEVQVNDPMTLDLMKSSYLKVVNKVTCIEQTIPTKWPQTLPNLSTHTAKPYIFIANSNDFICVLSAYQGFLGRMSSLKEHWTFSLRSLYSFLEETQNVSQYKVQF